MLLGEVFLSEKQVFGFWVTHNIFTGSLQCNPEKRLPGCFSLLILEFLGLKHIQVRDRV